MNAFNPKFTILPIVKASKDMPIQEILGTGCVIGKDKNVFLLTAKHIFQNVKLLKNDKLAFVFDNGKGIGIWAINLIKAAEDYDVAICEIEYVNGLVPLQFYKGEPSLISDVYCYEYSNTLMRKSQGKTHVSFEPLTHKGNIMRFFDSEFPEKKKTPCFITSFPALQGASGAPVLATTSSKNFYIAGIMVANQETHLMPAQIVEIIDGSDYLEQTSYFLPLGKGINAALIKNILNDMGIGFEYTE